MMWTLMRKDLRLLRPVFWGAAAMSVMFYVVLPIVGYLNWYRSDPLRTEFPTYYAESGHPFLYDVYTLSRQVQSGTNVMWFVDLVLLTVIGGTAFATERRERWSDLTAMLPISRGRTVAAKLRVSVAACFILLAVNTTVFVASTAPGPYPIWAWSDYAQWRAAISGAWYVGAAVALFGTAWVCSSLLRSPVVSTAIAFGIVVGYYAWCIFEFQATRSNQSDLIAAISIAAGVIAGVAFTAIGVIVQWKRSSP